MGAALHLAHAHQAQPDPRRKRKGGGGGRDGYDAIVAALYQDQRITREAREIALLLAWLIARDPNRFNAGVWQRAEAILGTRQYGGKTQSIAGLLVASDIPRYEDDRSIPAWHDQTCDAPMIRRAGKCGQPARDNSYTADPTTGWRTPVWYCRRHEGFGKDSDCALRDAPEPIPNRGGLLPSYFRRKNGIEGWVYDYRWAYHQKNPFAYKAWEPPSYGVDARLWPTPGGDDGPAIPDVPQLQLVATDGELLT